MFRRGDILRLGELRLEEGAWGKSQEHPLPEHRHVFGAGEVRGHGERGMGEVEVSSES